MDGAQDGGVTIVPQPHRKKDDMEIIEFDCYQQTSGPIFEALSCAHLFGGIDGSHHKMWVIDQMVRHLTGPDYSQWVINQKAGEDGPETCEWNVGTPP